MSNDQTDTASLMLTQDSKNIEVIKSCVVIKNLVPTKHEGIKKKVK
jgi:hypothetical protein